MQSSTPGASDNNNNSACRRRYISIQSPARSRSCIDRILLKLESDHPYASGRSVESPQPSAILGSSLVSRNSRRSCFSSLSGRDNKDCNNNCGNFFVDNRGWRRGGLLGGARQRSLTDANNKQSPQDTSTATTLSATTDSSSPRSKRSNSPANRSDEATPEAQDRTSVPAITAGIDSSTIPRRIGTSTSSSSRESDTASNSSTGFASYGTSSLTKKKKKKKLHKKSIDELDCSLSSYAFQAFDTDSTTHQPPSLLNNNNRLDKQEDSVTSQKSEEGVELELSSTSKGVVDATKIIEDEPLWKQYLRASLTSAPLPSTKVVDSTLEKRSVTYAENSVSPKVSELSRSDSPQLSVLASPKSPRSILKPSRHRRYQAQNQIASDRRMSTRSPSPTLPLRKLSSSTTKLLPSSFTTSHANTIVPVDTGDTTSVRNDTSSTEIAECVADLTNAAAAADRTTGLVRDKWLHQQQTISKAEISGTGKRSSSYSSGDSYQSQQHSGQKSSKTLPSKISKPQLRGPQSRSLTSTPPPSRVPLSSVDIRNQKTPTRRASILRQATTGNNSSSSSGSESRADGENDDTVSLSGTRGRLPSSRSTTPVQQHEELQQHQMQEVCRVVTPPPQLLSHDDKSTTTMSDLTFKKRSVITRKSAPVDLDSNSYFNVDAHLESLNQKAAHHVASGDYLDALDIFQIVLETHVKENPSSALVASTYHNMGIVYVKHAHTLQQQQQVKLEHDSNNSREGKELQSQQVSVSQAKALEAFRNAARIAREALGESHPNVAVSLVRIGFLLLTAGQHSKALVTFQEALRIRKAAFGRDHPLVAKVHNNIGVAYLHLGNHSEGLKSFESALEVQRSFLSQVYENHPGSGGRIGMNFRMEGGGVASDQISTAKLEVADTLCNIGSLCLDWKESDSSNTEDVAKQQDTCAPIGNQRQAESSFAEALAIRTAILGAEHAQTIQTRNLHDRARQLALSYPKIEDANTEKNLALDVDSRLNPPVRDMLVSMSSSAPSIHGSGHFISDLSSRSPAKTQPSFPHPLARNTTDPVSQSTINQKWSSAVVGENVLENKSLPEPPLLPLLSQPPLNSRAVVRNVSLAVRNSKTLLRTTGDVGVDRYCNDEFMSPVKQDMRENDQLLEYAKRSIFNAPRDSGFRSPSEPAEVSENDDTDTDNERGGEGNRNKNATSIWVSPHVIPRHARQTRLASSVLSTPSDSSDDDDNQVTRISGCPPVLPTIHSTDSSVSSSNIVVGHAHLTTTEQTKDCSHHAYNEEEGRLLSMSKNNYLDQRHSPLSTSDDDEAGLRLSGKQQMRPKQIMLVRPCESDSEDERIVSQNHHFDSPTKYAVIGSITASPTKNGVFYGAEPVSIRSPRGMREVNNPDSPGIRMGGDRFLYDAPPAAEPRNISSPSTVYEQGDIFVMPPGRNTMNRGNEDMPRQTIGEDEMVKNAEEYVNEIHDIAANYLKQNNTKKALYLFDVLLHAHKRVHGELHHTVGSTLHNIGIAYLRSEELYQALEYFQRAVRVRKGSAGQDHPDVADSIVKVGIVQLLLHQFDQALFSFRDALSVRRHALGHLHPSTARVYNNIGCVHVEFNELREARRAFEAALDVQRNSLCYDPNSGPLMFGAATTLCNLGYLYTHRGMHRKASMVLREALTLQETVLGASHPTVLATLESIADSNTRSEDFAEALRCYHEVLRRVQSKANLSQQQDDDEGDVGDNASKRQRRASAVLLYKMSRIHRKQNDNESALEKLREAHHHVLGLGVPGLERRVRAEIDYVQTELENSDLEWL